jgi:hypothetical protein
VYRACIESHADPAAVTPFFLPGVAAGAQERELARLHASTLRRTGCAPVERRIQRLVCRVGGRDCEIEVGRRSPINDSEIVASLDLGRHKPFEVFTTTAADEPSLLVEQVYSVTEFT